MRGHTSEQFTRLRSCNAKPGHGVRDVAHRHANARSLRFEPPLMPLAKIVGAHEPVSLIVPIEDCQITDQSPRMTEHRCQPCSSAIRKPACEHSIQPNARRGPSNL